MSIHTIGISIAWLVLDKCREAPFFTVNKTMRVLKDLSCLIQ